MAKELFVKVGTKSWAPFENGILDFILLLWSGVNRLKRRKIKFDIKWLTVAS